MSAESQPSEALSEEEFAVWMQPSAAVELLHKPLKSHEHTAIYEQLSAGVIAAYAQTIIITRDTSANTQRQTRARIPLHLIQANNWGPFDKVWATNQIVLFCENYHRTSTTQYQIFDIRLDPVAVRKLLPVTPPELSSLPAPPERAAAHQKHAGGAPPKDVWEAVWVDIAARLINGDFDPKKQGDIQKAIEEWAAANNEPIGETTAKRHAKLLWQKVKLGP